MFYKIWNWLRGVFTSNRNEVQVPQIPKPVEVPTPPQNMSWHKPTLTPFAIFHFKTLGEVRTYINNNSHIKLVNLELDQITPEVMSFLKEKRIRVCAYISASYEAWRDDASSYPDSAKGKKMSGWDELWGNICDVALQKFLAARFKRAKDLGVDYVEVDNVDIAFNDVGFKVTKDQNITAIKQLARMAHSFGLGYFLKNTPDLAGYVVYEVDGAFVEEAIEYKETDLYTTFVKAQKPIFGLEYGKAHAIRGWFIHSQGDYFDKSYKAYYTGY